MTKKEFDDKLYLLAMDYDYWYSYVYAYNHNEIERGYRKDQRKCQRSFCVAYKRLQEFKHQYPEYLI